MRVVRIGMVTAAVAAGLLFSAPPGHAVVGGTAVPNGAYPFMASVQSNGSHFCGGSVIAGTWVLTAAHCVPNGSAAGLSVVVGTNNNSNGSGTRISVDQVVVEPLYASNSLYDAALLRLHSTVPSGVTPITLSKSTNDNLEADGAAVTVAGWGDINPLTMGLLAPAAMQEAPLKVVGDQKCMGSTTSEAALTTVCAAALLKDSCQGDSGGPLFATNGTQRIQIGIVSRGFLCAIPTQPGMYSEVNNAKIWGFISSNAPV